MVSLMNVVDTLHEDVIHDAALDYYGVQLATCSSDNIVKIFNVKNGTFSHVVDLKGHFGPVWKVSWAHPKFGNILASCSCDKRVIVWKENREWTKMYEYNNHEGSVNSVTFGPPEFGLTLACASSDGAISILTLRGEVTMWETRKIANAHSVGVNAISWAPYASLHNIVNGKNSKPLKRIATAGSDSLVKIWAEVNGHWNEMATLLGHYDWVRDVAWAPSVTIPKARIASASQDKRVIIWSSDDEVKWTSYVLPLFDDVVWNVSWSPTGNLLAVSDGYNKVTLWKQVPSGEWNSVTEVADDNASDRSSETLLQHLCGEECFKRHT